MLVVLRQQLAILLGCFESDLRSTWYLEQFNA
jgi:hypothetical protein